MTPAKTPASPSRAEELDRRAHPRLCCKGCAEIHIYPERMRAVGSVANLSVQGCSIAADKKMPLLPHERVEVHLHLHGLTVQLAGIVRYMENNERVGIEFTDVSKRKAEQIEQLIEEIVEDDQAG
jgi:hypothetical protein